MRGLTRLTLTALPVIMADLLLFLHWYHLGNAQAKFLLYRPWLADANERFVASGFVAGSLVLLVALSTRLVLHMLGCRLQTAAWWQAAVLNALIIGPGVLLITQTANFDPPLWTALVALVLLLVLNTALFAAWRYFARIFSTVSISLLMIAAYGLSAIVLYTTFYVINVIFDFDVTWQWTSTLSILLLGAALPIFLILAVGVLWVWRRRHCSWQRPAAMFVCLGTLLLWVPCFAVAHYALASHIHYITNADNLLKNVGLALVCGPVLSSLLTFADAIVTRRLLSAYGATQTECPSLISNFCARDGGVRGGSL